MELLEKMGKNIAIIVEKRFKESGEKELEARFTWRKAKKREENE